MEDDAGARTVLAPAPGRALGSDPHDFAGLYIRHRTSFTSHARRYLRDPRDADEVVQEAFLRLFLAMPELETELQALAYCRRTITNLCIDRYRADARRPRLVALEGAPVDDLAEDDTGDPVVRAEDAALVREALSKLPELHRAALVMREIEEKPLPLIADELDVPEDSVKHLLFRARRALRKLLAGTSVAPGVDAEVTRGLRPLARGASGGVAGLLLLALLALGSGPDLRAVPVVGVDLPDVLGVTAVADAVRDVVDAVVPGQAPADAAAAGGPISRPVSRSEALVPAQAPPRTAGGQAAQPEGGTAAVGTSRPGPATAQSGLPTSGAPTATVTVVDGLPVVTLVPPTGDLTPAYGPAAQGRTTAPGTSTGRGAGASLPTSLVPLTAGRDVPVGRPVAPAVPVAGVPVRPGGSEVPGRSPRADDVVHEAADRAADTAQRVEKAAEKAADVADKAEAKADRAAQRAAVKSEQAVAKVAERAADKAGGRAADKAADKAARAAEKAAAERAAARAAEVAAAQAAELAAAAAAAAQQAAAAAVPVDAVATVPAP